MHSGLVSYFNIILYINWVQNNPTYIVFVLSSLNQNHLETFILMSIEYREYRDILDTIDFKEIMKIVKSLHH